MFEWLKNKLKERKVINYFRMLKQLNPREYEALVRAFQRYGSSRFRDKEVCNYEGRVIIFTETQISALERIAEEERGPFCRYDYIPPVEFKLVPKEERDNIYSIREEKYKKS